MGPGMSRDKYHISSLEVKENLSRSVSNSFIQQVEPSDKLALIYPGLRYSCDKPLLHYTTEILLARGFDVLQLWANYGKPEFQSLSQAEQTIKLIEDGRAMLHTGVQTKDYSQMVLVGKSLGTLTMAFILSEESFNPNLRTIWFTPLFHLPPVAKIVLELAGPIFVAGSEADSTFDSGAVSQVLSKSNITTQVVKNADHSLEIPGDPVRSTQVLSSLMAGLTEFIS